MTKATPLLLTWIHVVIEDAVSLFITVPDEKSLSTEWILSPSERYPE
jgi:hypothetical protein